jgi:hypothetical protein
MQYSYKNEKHHYIGGYLNAQFLFASHITCYKGLAKFATTSMNLFIQPSGHIFAIHSGNII